MPTLTRKKRDATDAVTRRWVRNRSDELAIENGCRFDVLAGAWAVFWIERYCRLYEGDQAGEPLILHGCHQCGDYGLPSLTEASWSGEIDGGPVQEIATKRAELHAKCMATRRSTYARPTLRSFVPQSSVCSSMKGNGGAFSTPRDSDCRDFHGRHAPSRSSPYSRARALEGDARAAPTVGCYRDVQFGP